MKHLIFILLLSFSAGAQIPNYFDDNQKWICEEHQAGVSGPCVFNNIYMNYLNGDTTIGVNSYKQLRRKGWTYESGCGQDPYDYYDNYVAGFRQENRAIYMHYSGQEYLFVDLDIAIGDTLSPCLIIQNPSLYGDSNFVVQSIDSVLFSSGYHRRYHFNYYDSWNNDTIPYYILEGVGVFSDNGHSSLPISHEIILVISEALEWNGYVNCYLQNDLPEYGAGQCDLNIFDFGLGVGELSASHKHLVKITDLMGREVPITPNTPLIYTYSDGTTEKVFRVE